ncbi:hypothetical protein [Synechococcus sp. GFB01]|uniref:hypothetical protein n=1 Tax=Synechococcus sp. GFB01 TaxID=1662190 RepID=UPI000AFE3BD8
MAVHHLPLDREEQLLPLDQRRAGVAGHGGPVLPLLWQELVERRGWSVEQLWQALSWGLPLFWGWSRRLSSPAASAGCCSIRTTAGAARPPPAPPGPPISPGWAGP